MTSNDGVCRSYLFLGDTHGDLDFVARAAEIAAEHEATIVQVGDWGYLWPDSNQITALSLELQLAGQRAARPPVEMLFIDGNHDYFPKIAEFVERGRSLPGGGVQIARHVTYQPRGSTYVDEDGTRFLFVGGAPSIDHAGRTPGRSWWPEEVISFEEWKTALAVRGHVDVLVTHDAPDYPPGFQPKGDPEFRVRSARSMDMIAKLIFHHRPALHVHGHWHARYSARRDATRVEGLDCNAARYFADSWMLWSRGAE